MCGANSWAGSSGDWDALVMKSSRRGARTYGGLSLRFLQAQAVRSCASPLDAERVVFLPPTLRLCAPLHSRLRCTRSCGALGLMRACGPLEYGIQRSLGCAHCGFLKRRVRKSGAWAGVHAEEARACRHGGEVCSLEPTPPCLLQKPHHRDWVEVTGIKKVKGRHCCPVSRAHPGRKGVDGAEAGGPTLRPLDKRGANNCLRPLPPLVCHMRTCGAAEGLPAEDCTASALVFRWSCLLAPHGDHQRVGAGHLGSPAPGSPATH